jgi:hypothetical protein
VISKAFSTYDNVHPHYNHILAGMPCSESYNVITKYMSYSSKTSMGCEEVSKIFWFHNGGVKIAVFWVVAPCCLVQVYRRFTRACCLHLQGINLTTRRNNPEDSHLQVFRNLLSYYSYTHLSDRHNPKVFEKKLLVCLIIINHTSHPF